MFRELGPNGKYVWNLDVRRVPAGEWELLDHRALLRCLKRRKTLMMGCFESEPDAESFYASNRSTSGGAPERFILSE